MSGGAEGLAASLADRYRVERELGAGGMAAVYLAEDLKHGRRVAIKVLRPELAAAIGAERFLREIRIAASLEHPHILTLIDSGEVPSTGALYYVMPFVEGESLRQRLAAAGPLPVADAVRILREILDALAYAHGRGIVHRDIKPENIMLSGHHALVVDFGIAKAIAATPAGGTALTTVGLAIGTPAYMAPEQALAQAEIDGRTDIYALGVVAYEMLSGHTPFAGTTAQAMIAGHVARAPAPLAAERAGIPPALAAAVMRCLEKDPGTRWQSAEELLCELEPAVLPPALPAATRSRPRWLIAAGALGLAVLLVAAWAWTGPMARVRSRTWAHETAIPRVLQLADAGDWEGAYALARTIERRVPGDSMFNALLPRFARRYTIHTVPAGATVLRKPYEAPDSAWQPLGKTPLDGVLVPLSASGAATYDANRIRITAPGYRALDLTGLPFADSVIVLDRDGALPPGMVRIGGGMVQADYPEFADRPPIPLGDFLMDRFEVTNRDYKRFVDSGGYRRPEFWTDTIRTGGRVTPWKDAMALLTDRTGRTGPATWEAGGPPAGRENEPVGGVSWYEARAYARFSGKSLPTVVHWSRAARIRNSSWIVPMSNFSGRGAVPAGSARGISAFGTYDMAGNVREWCLNASGTQRFILGGGWDDPPYRFNDAYAQDPLDRSPLNGIRLVRYESADSSVALAAAPATRRLRNLVAAKPVSDAVFAVYRQMYEYDHKPVVAVVRETLNEPEWSRQLVRLDAPYGNGNDSLLIYLYVPRRGHRPVPAVVFFPPGSAVAFPALPPDDSRLFDFMLKSGRAVIVPVYKGTYQRRDSLQSDQADSTIFYRDHVVMWGKDLRRAIDYLETRPDITTRQLAYYGVSWGGALGGLLPAIEPRIKLNVLQVAGLSFEPMRPEVDPVNYLPRIRVPTLMINGRYDFYFPVATSQEPMFRLLGTPPADKRHVIEEGSHFVPRVRLIQESLAWLDRYQPLEAR